MNFQTLLSTFVGRKVEVTVPSTMYEGILTSVQSGTIQVTEPPILYTPPVVVTITLGTIELVRVLAS